MEFFSFLIFFKCFYFCKYATYTVCQPTQNKINKENTDFKQLLEA